MIKLKKFSNDPAVWVIYKESTSGYNPGMVGSESMRESKLDEFKKEAKEIGRTIIGIYYNYSEFSEALAKSKK